jgi:Flp pilus assembly protein TadB
MLRESPVDEGDGSSCRRASNLIRNIVLSLALLLIILVVVRLILALAIRLVAIIVVALAPILCGSGSAKRAIGSHVIRGEVDALVEDS